MTEQDGKDDAVLRNSKKHFVFVYFVSILSAVGGFLFGYDTGVISGAMVQLRDFFGLTFIWQETIVSIAILSAWIFSLIGGFLADKYGRKRIIICASVFFTTGALMMGTATDKYELLLGRVVVGSGIGLASMTVPVYIAEVSPAELRGRLVTVNNCFITMGQFTASIVDGIFSANSQGWRYMLSLAAVPSVIQFVGFLFMPESPRWLIGKKKYNEALKVLHDIQGQNHDVKLEFNAIKSSCMDQEKDCIGKKGKGPIILQVLKNQRLRRALAVGCSLQIIQQIAGINTVMYYSATIIQMSGVRGTSKVIWLSTATAAMNAICSLGALYFVERFGRRILTLTSLAGVILSLSFLAVTFHVADSHSPPVTNNSIENDMKCSNYSDCSSCIKSGDCGFCYVSSHRNDPVGLCLACNDEYCSTSFANSTCSGMHLKENENNTWSNQWCPSSYSWMTLLGLLLYLFCFAPGLGSTPWTVNSEIYPLWARSTCYSTATSFNWFFNFIISLSFLSLALILTKSGVFWLYSGLAALGFVYLYLALPESKGISLEQVEEIFEEPYWHRLNFFSRRRVGFVEF